MSELVHRVKIDFFGDRGISQLRQDILEELSELQNVLLFKCQLSQRKITRIFLTKMGRNLIQFASDVSNVRRYSRTHTEHQYTESLKKPE